MSFLLTFFLFFFVDQAFAINEFITFDTFISTPTAANNDLMGLTNGTSVSVYHNLNNGHVNEWVLNGTFSTTMSSNIESIATDGFKFVVGETLGGGQESIQVFKYDGGEWVPDGPKVFGSMQNFGWDVDISGDVVVVGANDQGSPGKTRQVNYNSGSSTWVLSGGSINAGESTAGNGMGYQVALLQDGFFLVSTCLLCDSGMGRIIINQWNGFDFGGGVSIWGKGGEGGVNTALAADTESIGYSLDSDGTNNFAVTSKGRLHVFSYDTSWALTQTIEPWGVPGTTNDELIVAMDGGYIFLSNPELNQVKTYTYNGTTWEEDLSTVFTISTGNAGRSFATQMAAWGDTLVTTALGPEETLLFSVSDYTVTTSASPTLSPTSSPTLSPTLSPTSAPTASCAIDDDCQFDGSCDEGYCSCHYPHFGVKCDLVKDCSC